MDALSKRNFTALAEGLKEIRSEMSELKKANINKDEQIAQLRMELTEVKQKQNVMFAKSMGAGSTSKG